MKTKNLRILFVVILNLILGNGTLYIHEVIARNQPTLDNSLWISFSIASIFILLFNAKYLNKRKSLLFFAFNSLFVSFIIPLVGFIFSFGPKGSILGTIYLLSGFNYLILPLFIINFFAFRWISKTS